VKKLSSKSKAKYLYSLLHVTYVTRIKMTITIGLSWILTIKTFKLLHVSHAIHCYSKTTLVGMVPVRKPTWNLSDARWLKVNRTLCWLTATVSGISHGCLWMCRLVVIVTRISHSCPRIWPLGISHGCLWMCRLVVIVTRISHSCLRIWPLGISHGCRWIGSLNHLHLHSLCT